GNRIGLAVIQKSETFFDHYLFRLERVLAGGGFGGTTSAFVHNRKTPRKALAFSPARQRPGSASSFLAVPPPITVSSGRSAATRRSTTSATRRCHFFLPFRSSPARPIYRS